VGFAHPWESSDENKQQHQNHVSRVIIRPIRSVSKNPFQSATQTQLVTKPLDQEQTAEMRERIRLERKIQCLQALSHVSATKKQVLLPAPITVQNGRLLALGQNVEFFYAIKPFETIFRSTGAFLRFQRWGSSV
jgi:hypothetical protein